MAARNDAAAALDPEDLIMEVFKRPSLWDPFSILYKDKIKKQSDWFAIGKALLPYWDCLTASEQLEIIKQNLQRKWKNLRDRFVKEHNLTDDNTKKGTYTFYTQLQFLIPTLHAQLRRNSFFEVTVGGEGRAGASGDPLRLPKPGAQPGAQPGASPRRAKRRASPELLQLLAGQGQGQGQAEAGGDSDRMFLLSLLPVMQHLSPAKKIKARIDLLQVMQSYLK